MRIRFGQKNNNNNNNNGIYKKPSINATYYAN